MSSEVSPARPREKGSPADENLGILEGPLRTWKAVLAAGWVPALGLGFLWSALADRLIFVAWGLAAALLYSWVLRRGFEGGFATTGGLAVAALAFLVLAWLVARHREALDVGYRAFLPSLYVPWVTHPATCASLGGGSAVGAALAWFKDRKRRRLS